MKSDAFDDVEKRGLYRAIFERKDIRTYKPDEIPADVLERILNGAHHAPSVGFMQPWNFVLIDSDRKKREVYSHFLDVNESSAKLFPGERNVKYRSLKLQGILDAPLNILVTCDTRRGGQHVLGRTTIPETDIYSTCLAIQNLWLCARAEGIGVGWMSLYIPEVISRIFSLPDHVVPVAYLTAGYAVEFPETPILESVGWRKRLPLNEVLFFNTWGKDYRGLAGDDMSGPESFDGGGLLAHLAETLAKETSPERGNSPDISPLSDSGGSDKKNGPQEMPAHLSENFRKRNDDLTKPPGSLGRLEGLMERLCQIQGDLYPRSEMKKMVIAAGDHGVVEEGVSAYRRELTAKMVYQFLAGGGAISSLARQYRIRLHVVDAGVDHDFEGAAGLVDAKVRRSTRNMTREAAMTIEETELALRRGRDFVSGLGETDILGLGEMGIGNTTSASAMASVLLGLAPEMVTGLGTGVGETTLGRKTEVIRKALSVHGYMKEKKADSAEAAKEALRIFGGYEIAFLTGVILGAFEAAGDTARKIPVVLDGFITSVAALVAVRLNPSVAEILIAGHLSKEPGHRLVLEELGLEPVLDLSMALGEGSGAAFAMGVLDGAVRIMREMKTFEEAGIENPVDVTGKM